MAQKASSAVTLNSPNYVLLIETSVSREIFPLLMPYIHQIVVKYYVDDMSVSRELQRSCLELA